MIHQIVVNNMRKGYIEVKNEGQNIIDKNKE